MYFSNFFVLFVRHLKVISERGKHMIWFLQHIHAWQIEIIKTTSTKKKKKRQITESNNINNLI